MVITFEPCYSYGNFCSKSVSYRCHWKFRMLECVEYFAAGIRFSTVAKISLATLATAAWNAVLLQRYEQVFHLL